MTLPLQYGGAQRALLLAAAMTIVMSQLELSEETMIFYKAIRGVTICLVLLLVGATLLIAYHESEVRAAEALKAQHEPLEKRKEPPGTIMPKVAYSVWENMAMHPSNAISTWTVKPRLFPFPLGKSGQDKNASLWFESGTPPQVGHVKRPEEKYTDRFKAARKEATAHDPEKIRSKRLEAIRKYEFDTRRKQWKRRFEHMKALCVVIILSYLNQKLALFAMALLIWRVINSELARLMDKEPGADMHEEYSARFGTYAVARQRPAGMASTKTDMSQRPDMGMAYLYQPAGKNPKDGFSATTSHMPIRQPSTSLLTSQNQTLSGTRVRYGETEEDAGDLGGLGSGLGGSSGLSGMGGMGGLGSLGGMGAMGGFGGLGGLSGLGMGSGMSSLGDLGAMGGLEGEDLDLSSVGIRDLQRMAGEEPIGVITPTDRRLARARQEAEAAAAVRKKTG